MIIKVDDNTFIKYDNQRNTSQVIKLDELETLETLVEERLAELEDTSDEALLAWAKKNFPGEAGIQERASLENQLTIIKADLAEIKDL